MIKIQRFRFELERTLKGASGSGAQRLGVECTPESLGSCKLCFGVERVERTQEAAARPRARRFGVEHLLEAA